MVKQKIVVKVAMINVKKARKALKIAVTFCGVESAALDSDKDQIVVTGEGMDPVELTKSLRKRVGCTDLISFGPVEEKKPAPSQKPGPVDDKKPAPSPKPGPVDEKKPAPSQKPPSAPLVPLGVYYHHSYHLAPCHLCQAPYCYHSSCTIM